jgi:hypothetical protein
MSFETISMLLNWMELGVLLAILFRLSSTFGLIAKTQRELRRAIYHLGERPANELNNRPARVRKAKGRLGLPLPVLARQCREHDKSRRPGLPPSIFAAGATPYPLSVR